MEWVGAHHQPDWYVRLNIVKGSARRRDWECGDEEIERSEWGRILDLFHTRTDVMGKKIR